MKPHPRAREMLAAWSDALHEAILKVSVYALLFQPGIFAQLEIKEPRSPTRPVK